MKVSDLKKLNRKLLWKQFLSEKRDKAKTPPVAAESIAGANSQNLRDSYLSFWSRMKDFSDNILESQYMPGKGITRTWTVRGTVHTFPTEHYSAYVFGSPGERYLSSFDSYASRLGILERDYRIEKLYIPLIDAMQKSAVPTNFISNFIADRLEEAGIKSRRNITRGWSNESSYGPIWNGTYEMSYLGLIVNAGKRGSESMWMSTDAWIPYKLRDPDREECAADLIRKYIRAYGPVTLNDIIYWTGHRKTDVVRIIDRIRDDLYTLNYGDEKREYFSMEDEREDFPEPDDAIILPRFDSIMMGYEDKARILPDGTRNKIFANAGVIKQTVLVNGFAAGTWKKSINKRKVEIKVDTFRTLTSTEKRSVREKFSEYSEYLGKEITLRISKL